MEDRLQVWVALVEQAGRRPGQEWVEDRVDPAEAAHQAGCLAAAVAGNTA